MNEQDVFALIEKAKSLDPEDIEAEMENMAATIHELGEIADVELPESAKGFQRAAVKNAMHGVDVATFGVVAGYDDDEQRADAQRVVRARDAMMALAMAEDDLLANEVQSPTDSFLAPYVSLWKTVVWLIDHRQWVWRAIKGTVKGLSRGDKLGLIVGLAFLVAGITVVATASLTMASFTASAARMVKARNFHLEWLRQQALKQQHQTRYKRSRRAR